MLGYMTKLARRSRSCSLSRLLELWGTSERTNKWVYSFYLLLFLMTLLQVIALRAVQSEDFMTADW